MAKKLYFDNEAATKAVVHFQRTGEMENINIMFDQFQALVRGVINTHKIYRFWNNVDELVQEGCLAILSAFGRFDNDRGTTLFSYLSIVVKQHLKNWTKAQNKQINSCLEFQDSYYLSDENAVEENFSFCDYFPIEKIPENLRDITDDIDKAINVYRINNYQDLNSWLKNQGWAAKDLKQTLKIIKEHYSLR